MLEVLFLSVGNYFDSLYFYLKVVFIGVFALTGFISLIRWVFKEPKEKDTTPKQEIKLSDYQIVLDSMLIYGIINMEQYNEYLTNGLPFFNK